MRIQKCLFMIMVILFTVNIYAKEVITFTVNASSLNIRLEPSKKSEAIGKVSNNSEIQIIENSEVFDKIDNIVAPWIKVKYDNRVGYVFGGYITKITKYDNGYDLKRNIYQLNITKIKSKGIVTNSNSVVYEYPSIKSQSIAKIDLGSNVEILSRTYTESSLKNKQFWFQIQYNGKQGYILNSNIISNIYESNGFIYGINDYPVSKETDDEFQYIQTNSEVVVFSKKTNSVIQNFNLPEKSDELSILLNHKFNNYFKNCIIITHRWNGFHTGPIGYTGNIVYSIGDDGKIGSKIFSWFDDIGEQDEPWAQIKNIEVSKQSISMTYEYYDSIGLPPLGYGTFIINYNVDKIPVFITIVSKVIKTHESKNGSYSTDDEHKLKKPIIIQFTKDSINSKFKYMSKVYQFIN